MRMMLIKVVLLLAVCLFAVAAYGQQTSSGSLPSPALYFKFGLSGIAGDQQYLYVMTGGKIMQYRNENGALTLLASFDLPQPPVPSGAQPPPRATGHPVSFRRRLLRCLTVFGPATAPSTCWRDLSFTSTAFPSPV